MKALLAAAVLAFSAPAFAEEFNIYLAQEQADENRLTCFEGMNHDESPASKDQINSACKALIELTAELKENNICKTADDVLVKCPE